MVFLEFHEEFSQGCARHVKPIRLNAAGSEQVPLNGSTSGQVTSTSPPSCICSPDIFLSSGKDPHLELEVETTVTPQPLERCCRGIFIAQGVKDP